MKQPWYEAGIEPDLDALLHDDELALIIRYDGLTADDYWRHIARARNALMRRRARTIAASLRQPATAPNPQPASMELATATAR